jgi:hypothetical protein
LMSSLTIEILRASAGLGLSIEDLKESGMDRVVDMCVSGLSASFTMGEGEELESQLPLLMSLLAQYSDFVTSDLSEDQFPISSVNPFLRSSSFHLSFPSSLSLPRTSLESVGDINQHSISLPPNLSLPLKISISETLVQSTSSSSSLNASRRLSPVTNESTTQLSLPLFVSLGHSCPSENCLMKVMLQHKIDANLLTRSTFLPSNATNYFEAECVVGVVKHHEFLCPSGDELVISCNGSVSGLARQHCPMKSFVTLCETKVQLLPSPSSSVDLRDYSCTVSPSESNESVTTCLCDLSTFGSVGNSATISFSLLSIQKSVVTDFVSTWETAPSLSSGQVTGSWVVLLTVAGVGLSFVLMMSLGVHTDKHESKLVSRIETEQQIPDDFEKTKERNFLEDALPSIFKSDPLWIKVQQEMKVYHRWFGIVFYYSPEFPRSMRVLSLFSSIVIMLFIQSVTYNIADPDDGSCEKCQSEGCCLSLKSTLNGKENRCYWESAGELMSNITSPSSFWQGSCSFREIGEDMTRMFIVAVISAILSAPLALSLQYLILNVLSKNVSEEATKKEKQKSRSHSRRAERLRITRGVTPLSSSEPVESCGRTLLEILNNLLKELSTHYIDLMGQGKDTNALELRSKSRHLSIDPFLPSHELFQMPGDLL